MVQKLPMQIVTTHKNTDFDALASSFCASLIYPGSIVVIPRSINSNVKDFLSLHRNVFQFTSPGDIDPERVERMIVVDTHQWNRLDGMAALSEKTGIEIHIWDHHTENGSGQSNDDIPSEWTCIEKIGSTVTLMIRKLKEKRTILTPIQATLFLAGIYEDTGHLTFPSTTAEDAYAAAFLLERKADLSIIERFLRPAYGVKQKNILFEMLKIGNRQKINGFTVGIAMVDIHGHVGNLAVVVNMYRDIMNVDAAFGIFFNKDKCIVIGRSALDTLDVGEIMRKMGGGGHPGAGSALLKSIPADEAKKTLIRHIERAKLASPTIGDLMSFPVFTISPDTKMKEVAMLLREKGCTGFPVVDHDKIIGMISRRDFKRMRNESSDLAAPVKAFMSTNVMTISPEQSPMEATKLMVGNDIGRLPVVQDGSMVGIITRSDAMTYFYDLLPD